MARDKERSVNPAAAQRKAEKQKAIKKNKSSTQILRNEKLARRNPERLQTQINDLKALEAKGDLKPRERAILEELEKDVRAIKKAREALGDKAPRFGSGNGNYRREGDGHVLGKRRRDGETKELQEPASDDTETDEDVRRIPMPRDTPPPIPRASYRRPPQHGTDANNEPLGVNHSLPPKPAAPAQTIYSSAPQIRDLKQEAVKRFVPSIVRQKQQAARGGGAGALVEPEELDKLEAEGYGRTAANLPPATSVDIAAAAAAAAVEEEEEEEEAQRLAEEEERFRREMEMEVEVGGGGMEDVEDTTEQLAPPQEPQAPETSNRTKKPLQPLVEDVSDEDI